MVYAGGPYLTLGTILSANALEPVNIPAERVTDALTDVMDRLYTDFVPWEWWITYSGEINIGQTRGSDKSASVSIVAGDKLNIVECERSIKQSAQRVRVVGQGESKIQDDGMSDWQEDSNAMDVINGFYEKLESEKVLSSKSQTDIYAQVLLALLKDVREEITIKDFDNSPYTANDYDVGDYITVTDPKTGLSGAAKVYTIDKTIDGDGGEDTTLVLHKKRTDITDRLASLQKTLNKLLSSGTLMDTLLGSGGNQSQINANKVVDVWEQTSSNKWYTALPEDEAEDPALSYCNWAGRGDIGYSCDKEEFEIHGAQVSAGGEVFLTEPLLKFSRSPKFTCEFEIDTDIGTAWDTDDMVWIRIWELDTLCDGLDPDNPDRYCCAPFGDRGFGFAIQKTAVGYELFAFLNDGVDVRLVKMANITIDVKYTIEARLEWDERVVKYYFGRSDVEVDDIQWGFRLRGILPISLSAEDEGNLSPFNVTLDASSGTTQPRLVIYRWRTQAIRAV